MSLLLNINFNYKSNEYLQVAFGEDFTKSWNDQMSGLKFAKGDGKLTFLMDNSLAGSMKAIHLPWFKVRKESSF